MGVWGNEARALFLPILVDPSNVQKSDQVNVPRKKKKKTIGLETNHF